MTAHIYAPPPRRHVCRELKLSDLSLEDRLARALALKDEGNRLLSAAGRAGDAPGAARELASALTAYEQCVAHFKHFEARKDDMLLRSHLPVLPGEAGSWRAVLAAESGGIEGPSCTAEAEAGPPIGGGATPTPGGVSSEQQTVARAYQCCHDAFLNIAACALNSGDASAAAYAAR